MSALDWRDDPDGGIVWSCSPVPARRIRTEPRITISDRLMASLLTREYDDNPRVSVVTPYDPDVSTMTRFDPPPRPSMRSGGIALLVPVPCLLRFEWHDGPMIYRLMGRDVERGRWELQWPD